MDKPLADRAGRIEERVALSPRRGERGLLAALFGEHLDTVIESNLQDEITDVLRTLSPKEEKVIRMRFGIGCDREHTLAEIGQEFALTRERIRQIEAKALRALRSPDRARRLRVLMAAKH